MYVPPAQRVSRVARLLLWLSTVPPVVRVLLPLVIWAAGAWLLTRTPTTEGPLLGPLQAMFSSLKLFALDPPGFPAHPRTAAGALLWATYLLAPLLTATAAADFVRRNLLAPHVLVRGLSGHTVVCGLGNHGRVIARECDAAEHKLVVLDLAPVGVGSTLNLGADEALMLRGDMTERDALLAAGVLRARRVFFASGDPLLNMEAARSVRALCMEVGVSPPKLHALVDEVELLKDILGPLGLRREDLVDQFIQAARVLLGKPKVAQALMALAAGEQAPHVAVVGFGRFGQAVLRGLLSSPLLPPVAEGGPALTIELVDPRGELRARRFADAFTERGWRLSCDAQGDAERWALAHRGEQRPSPGLVFMCIDNDALSLRCAAQLCSECRDVAVVLRVARAMQGEQGAIGVIPCSVPELFSKEVQRLLAP